MAKLKPELKKEELTDAPPVATGSGTEMLKIPIERLVPAVWNYKTDGTPEQIEKLCKSIVIDKSAGVLAIREIIIDGEMFYEVIDGNHRLKAVALLGWKEIWCENFGTVSMADTVTISRRRNESWFETDTIKLAQLYKDEVLPVYTEDELAEFMPESAQDIKDMIKLLDFDWDSIAPKEEGDGADDNKKDNSLFKLHLNPKQFQKWEEWRQNFRNSAKSDSSEEAFAAAMEIALASVPTDDDDDEDDSRPVPSGKIDVDAPDF